MGEFSSWVWGREGGKAERGRRGERIEDTGDDSAESEDPHEWCGEKVSTFLRSLGTPEWFQSAGDHPLHLGVDDSVFFGLSVNELEGRQLQSILTKGREVWLCCSKIENKRDSVPDSRSQHILYKSHTSPSPIHTPLYIITPFSHVWHFQFFTVGYEKGTTSCRIWYELVPYIPSPVKLLGW